jgi:hypothetical protein
MDCGPTDGNSLRRTHPRAIPRPAGTHSSRTELHAATRELLETAPDLIGEFVRAGIQAGGQVPAHAYLDAQQERQHFAALWARFFDRYDLLLTPGAAITAFGAKIRSQAGSMTKGRTSLRRWRLRPRCCRRTSRVSQRSPSLAPWSTACRSASRSSARVVTKGVCFAQAWPTSRSAAASPVRGSSNPESVSIHGRAQPSESRNGTD